MVAAALVTFAVVFAAELVDTSGLATLVLASRFPPRWVLLGVAAGMAVHVVVAVAVGSLLVLLPERILEAVLAAVFLVGAVWLLFEDDDEDDEAEDHAEPKTRWGVVGAAFGVTVLSEFADPSQLVIATLAARYAAPVVVGIAALLALWAVSGLAVYAGNRLQRFASTRWLTRAVVAVLVVLAVLSAIAAIQG
jgi:Ca2+/H+ antiporter, TMEM165/GDT1 family